MQEELEQAHQLSPLHFAQVKQRYETVPIQKYPMDYSDFKHKYYHIFSQMRNFASQAQVSGFFNRCLLRNNHEAINQFLDYMVARREEQALRAKIEEKIVGHITGKEGRSEESLELTKLLRLGQNKKLSMEQLVNTYIEMTPSVKDLYQTVKERQVNSYKAV